MYIFLAKKISETGPCGKCTVWHFHGNNHDETTMQTHFLTNLGYFVQIDLVPQGVLISATVLC